MTDVALIGCDGAGKTTVADMLMARRPFPVRYVYMGVNAASSNIALPTTKLVYWLKVRKVRRRRRAEGADDSAPISLHGLEHRRDGRGSLWAAARLVNRVAEELLRLGVSTWYQLRGYVVVYDRHFLFDYVSSGKDVRLTDRIHRWFLERVYPKPDLVIFLDAPAEQLFARKPEVPISYLDKRRNAYLRQGRLVDRFETVDASQPVDDVYRAVIDRISAFLESGGEPKQNTHLDSQLNESGRGR